MLTLYIMYHTIHFISLYKFVLYTKSFDNYIHISLSLILYFTIHTNFIILNSVVWLSFLELYFVVQSLCTHIKQSIELYYYLLSPPKLAEF